MFALSIALTLDRLEAIKSCLLKALPDVKSSHRCEALGRGLGFSSYAAARASASGQEGPVVTVDGEAFVRYLARHEFHVQARSLYFAVAKVAIHAVAEANPQLTSIGIGIGRPTRIGRRWQTTEERIAEFRDGRSHLLGDDTLDGFLASLAFLARVTPTKTIRQGTSSYWLKHIAENYVCTYPEGDRLGPVYVPNGILIAAALHSGFRMKTAVDEGGWPELNVSFNMSTQGLNDLDCEIRPDGARAQDRRWREDQRRTRGRYGSVHA
ncbi:hypothetical protein [Novosphingobium terrae]|uniref:hypothetical protein n=1 Tax=Novosphingobium terrae TaxID=2726189 RepID=UPI00197D0DA3|nr:hypothetical protein [Novosphingobium terrae]